MTSPTASFPTRPIHGLAQALTSLGATEAIIKDGRHGATAIVRGQLLVQPAIETRVVDEVGAGDAFVAGHRLTGGDQMIHLSYYQPTMREAPTRK